MSTYNNINSHAAILQKKLTQALAPTLLEIIDEGAQHIGHAEEGAGGLARPRGDGHSEALRRGSGPMHCCRWTVSFDRARAIHALVDDATSRVQLVYLRVEYLCAHRQELLANGVRQVEGVLTAGCCVCSV